MVKNWLPARVVSVVAGACCVFGGLVAGVPGMAAAPAAAAPAAGATFVPLGPVRVMDTRNGTGGHAGPVGPGKTISLQVAGVAGVPSSGVTAVVLNVTATNPTASSFVTVFPDGSTRPVASNLNFTRGQTIPNLVTVAVGADGKIDFYNSFGSVNLIGDLAGYDTDSGSGSLLGSLGPVRVMDTRNGTGVAKAPVGPGKTVSLQVAGVAGVPASGVSAVVLNVTATSPTASSFVTVYPDRKTRPVTSNLNFTRGETIPNLVVVPVGADGKVDFYNSFGSVNLIADLAGYYTAAGAGFAPLGPVRVMDTRNGTGVPKAPVGPGKTVSLQVAGVAGVPSSGVTAVVLNVTATTPTASSFVTVFPDGHARPLASNLNFTPGETIPNLVVVPVGADGKVDFYNSFGSVNLIADLAGYYTAGGAPWGNAIEVPGLAALSGSRADVNSVSCPSAGNCAASGQYTDSSGKVQVFVTNEVNGTWGDAIEVPGSAALNTGGNAFVFSVSCASAGNCAVGGYYTDGLSNQQAFVADEVNGTWGDAIEVPGTDTLNVGSAQVFSLSCASAGNCAVGGAYSDSSGALQAFVADEVNGTWGDAIEVPGSAALNTGGFAQTVSLSCASAGNCAVGGYYANNSSIDQAFVADEVNGTWGNAIEVPGTAALNLGGAQVGSVSCASAGNCAAGGTYDNSTGVQAFVVSEVNGTWGNAIEVPGSAALNTGGGAFVSSVSCPSAGNCAAGGEVAVHSSSGNGDQPFVVSEVNGTWGNAIQVPGIPPDLPGGTDQVNSVSCASPGNCVAGGYYGENGDNFAFVVSEANGTWGEAIQVPGTQPGDLVNSVSCPTAGGCTAGGTIVASQN